MTITISASEFPVLSSPLLGRDDELTSLRERLIHPTVRLLTLTGPGGTGKTCLALEFARRQLDTYPDGVHFVDLSAVRDPALVLDAIARNLGIHDAGDQPLIDTVRQHLQSRHLLLILDNVEQVIEAAPLFADLLATCPKLKILVTSRESLRLSWEYEQTIPPLALPLESDLNDPEAIARSPAVALFVRRAQSVSSSFQLSAENASTVARICIRLDGLPLAIELAAAHCRYLPLETIYARLNDRFALLTTGFRDAPARHQTLRQAIAWSYDLLTPSEQAVFRRLSVFRRGGTMEAARAVAGDDATLPCLEALIGKNLLAIESDPLSIGDDRPRFRMLETIREFGWEQLGVAGELGEIQRRHAEYYLRLAEAAETGMVTHAQVAWIARMESEHDNLRAVLDASLSGQISDEIGLRLAAATPVFWLVRGRLTEGRELYERLRIRCQQTSVEPLLESKIIFGGALLAWRQCDYTVAKQLCEDCLARSQAFPTEHFLLLTETLLGIIASSRGDYRAAQAHLQANREAIDAAQDRRAAFFALASLGLLAYRQGDFLRARDHFEKALSSSRDFGEGWGTAFMVDALGAIAHRLGDPDRAVVLHSESLALSERLGDKVAIALSLANLGHVARGTDDLARARAYYDRSLRLYRETGDRRGVAVVLGSLGLVAESLGDVGLCRQYLEESLALARTIGDERGVVTGLLRLVRFACAQDRLDEARERLFECLTTLKGWEDRRSLGAVLIACSAVAVTRHKPDVAAQFLGMITWLNETGGCFLAPRDHADLDKATIAVRDALDPGTFQRAWNAGRERSSNDVLEQAARLLGDDFSVATVHRSRVPTPHAAPLLTHREAEVAALITRGLTNREIASALVIAERTADTHVQNILSKLGVTTRAQVAAWFVSYQHPSSR